MGDQTGIASLSVSFGIIPFWSEIEFDLKAKGTRTVMKTSRHVTWILAVALSAISNYGIASCKSEDQPFWTGKPDAAAFEKTMDERLARAQSLLDRMIAVKGTRTIANTLTVYDEILMQLDAAGAQSSLMEVVHPDKTLREAAEKVTQKVSSSESLNKLHDRESPQR